MKKRLQNKISESRLTLPFMIVYACVCWILCGLIQRGMWLQFGCFALSAHVMLLLNNSNALIRIYSRMVSSTFLALSCMACFLFPSVTGAISQFFFIATYLILFFTYQDQHSPGLTYYAFLCFGLCTLTSVHFLFLFPLLWLLMLTNLQSLSWRNFFASLFGFATPFWLTVCWGFFQKDLSFFSDYFQPLGDFSTPFDLSILDSSQKITLAFMAVMAIISTLHFWHNSNLDKYRIRQLYSLFIRVDLVVFFLIFLQPQHYDHLIRLAIINTSPLIAHFFALSNSKWTNITFIIVTLFILSFTAYNVWMSSSLF